MGDDMKNRVNRGYFILQISLLVVVLCVIRYEIKLLQTERMIRDIKRNGIDYDAFRALDLGDTSMEVIDQKLEKLIKRHPRLKDYAYVDKIGYLTFSMLLNDFDLLNCPIPDGETFLRGMAQVADAPCFSELYTYYRAILEDIRYFPVPRVRNQDADITYVDTWYVLRSYGGKRRHEGCDLMASNNVRGYFPVVSITDGVIENIGWLEQGGYRIGIRSCSGGYFYYAHLDTYAPGLRKGDKVIAGQMLGFMGDSGYGKEGTVGEFDVHLHMGIYVPNSTGDLSINPYRILKMLERKRTEYSMQMK